MLQVDVVGGEEEAAEAADDVGPVLQRLEARLLLLLLPGDVLPEDADDRLVLPPAVEHPPLDPAHRLPLQAVEAALLLKVPGLCRLLPQVAQREHGQEALPVVRVDVMAELVLGVDAVVHGGGLLRLGGPGQVQQLALPALQVHGDQRLEPGLEDSGQLGVPPGVDQLPAHPVIHVLEGQDGVAPCPGLLAEVGGDGDIAVVRAAPPLAQQLRPRKALRPGPAQALQGEALLEGFPVGLLEAVPDMQAHQLVPGQGKGHGAAPHLPVYPDGVRRAGLQVNGVDVEILLPKAADKLLTADAHALPLHALPQRVMDVLDTEDGGADVLGAGLVWDDLHQVPAAACRRQTAVEQGQELPSPLEGGAHTIQLDKGDKALHVLLADGAAPGKRLQLHGEGPVPGLPAVGAGFQHLASVPDKIHPQKLAVGIADGVCGNVRFYFVFSLLQSDPPNGPAGGAGPPSQRHKL